MVRRKTTKKAKKARKGHRRGGNIATDRGAYDFVVDSGTKIKNFGEDIAKAFRGRGKKGKKGKKGKRGGATGPGGREWRGQKSNVFPGQSNQPGYLDYALYSYALSQGHDEAFARDYATRR
jgi:hypothetical protein